MSRTDFIREHINGNGIAFNEHSDYPPCSRCGLRHDPYMDHWNPYFHERVKAVSAWFDFFRVSLPTEEVGG